MAKLVKMSLIGATYCRGHRIPGYGVGKLDDGKDVYVPEDEAIGFDGILDYCERLGHDVREARERTDHWVKTGTWLPIEVGGES